MVSKTQVKTVIKQLAETYVDLGYKAFEAKVRHYQDTKLQSCKLPVAVTNLQVFQL